MQDELRKKITKEYGYSGKPKQWQMGFDSAMKELKAILPQWTSVEDGLPEEEGEFITWSGHFSSHTGYYRGHWASGRIVTHWQSLPTPPKEKLNG